LSGVSVAPSVAAALDALPDLPVGGLIVTRGGAVIRAGGVVTRETEPEDALLDAEISQLGREIERRTAAAATLRSEASAEQTALAAATALAVSRRSADLSARSTLRSATDLRAESERELIADCRSSRRRSAISPRGEMSFRQVHTQGRALGVLRKSGRRGSES
jgi:chromosome segregation ATPase